MKLLHTFYVCALALSILPIGRALAQPASLLAPDRLSATTAESSSLGVALPEAPEMVVVVRKNDRSRMNILYQTHMRPFSHWAVAYKAGLAGVGVDVATPLANKWNLRAGFSMLGGDWNFKTSGVGNLSNGLEPLKDGISVELKPRFRTISTSLDWFPRYGNFRISPGLTVYNGNRGSALATVKGGQVLSLGDGDYTSDPKDPILATISMDFGHKIAPSLTIGWGNMLPREGAHFSFPFEIGFQYIGRPKIHLALSGNDCDSEGDCGPIANDPSTIENALSEQNQLTKDVAPLRFYPILSSGVAYRF